MPWMCYCSIFPTSDTPQGSYYQLFSFTLVSPFPSFISFYYFTTCFTFYLSCFLCDSVIGPLDTCFVSRVFVYFTLTLQLFFSLSLLSTFLLLFISRQSLLMSLRSSAAGMLSLSSLHQTSILWDFTSVSFILSRSLEVKWHSQGPWVILAAVTSSACAKSVRILSFHNKMR